MQSPIFPIQHSDAQWATYTASTSAAQPVAAKPVADSATAQSTPTLLMNSMIILLLLGAFGAIVYKKRREDCLHQQIRRLEKLWQFESHSPFEERH